MVTARLHLDPESGIAVQVSADPAGAIWETLGYLQTDGAEWWRAGERVRGQKHQSLVSAIEALLDKVQFTTRVAVSLGVGSE